MKVIYKENIAGSHDEIVSAIKQGKIFIYPTDTIYGLGCDATNEQAVEKIRAIKNRPDRMPFSVIAPSKSWILETCEVKNELLLEKLPGPYTLIFPLQEKSVPVHAVNHKDDTLGVRIPHHWFTHLVEEAGVPFVTTSVNVTGDKFMKKFGDISEEMKEVVDYCIYEGEIKGIPSRKEFYI